MSINIERVCGNCSKFRVLESQTQAIDVMTGKSIPAGRRVCSAEKIAWADTPCTTGEFEANTEVSTKPN